ncbi:ABC transporter substrate-binding protein [Mycolicibacterium phlei]|jgi:NitT/TauT family transport system substrate-binding protein|uniref:ABC transporter substrate-binding protein n=1 Tax=Mycolicibacterium phlei TaxID=1771 RepID=UPI00025AF344|nr:ABC transporter substrate-binding protein [Mycolicibacterium phlei]EID09281.1 ABC transporter substrate-binding protein [Mycolicibacterium phlei RIVM601174]MBF4192218.1 ABC transporter substrate-binding protein [Mycolicibacterium phlei]
MRITKLKVVGALIAALALAVAGLTGCSSSESSEGQRELTVGFVVDPSWAHIPVAQQEGYFADRGLNVKVVNFSTGVEALQALTAGQVDVTTAAAVPTSAAVIKTPTLRVAADGSRWEGFRLVARKQSGIRSLQDLNGKRIGTPLGTSGAYFASKVVEGSGTDAELVQVAPSAIVTAITQGDVDAVSIFQPYQAQAIAALGADAVALEPPGGTLVDHCLFVTTEAAASERQADLTAFFEALGDASKDLTAQTDGAVTAVADATKLDPALVKDVLSGYDFTLQLKPALADDLAALGAWAQQNGKIEPNVTLPDYSQFLDTQFIKS